MNTLLVSRQEENEDVHAISDVRRPSRSEVPTTFSSWLFRKVGLTGVWVWGYWTTVWGAIGQLGVRLDRQLVLLLLLQGRPTFDLN